METIYEDYLYMTSGTFLLKYSDNCLVVTITAWYLHPDLKTANAICYV